MRAQHRLIRLHLSEQFDQPLCSEGFDAHGHSVDRNAHNPLDVLNFRWPAGDGNSEHHVLASGQPTEHDRPGRLNESVERQTLGARPPDQCGGDLSLTDYS